MSSLKPSPEAIRGTVHPFYDGNGRTGRYLLALYLSSPLSILTTLSLSRVIAANRDAYYRSFKEAEHPLNHGELTHFVMNMLENVRIAQNDLDVLRMPWVYSLRLRMVDTPLTYCIQLVKRAIPTITNVDVIRGREVS